MIAPLDFRPKQIPAVPVFPVFAPSFLHLENKARRGGVTPPTGHFPLGRMSLLSQGDHRFPPLSLQAPFWQGEVAKNIVHEKTCRRFPRFEKRYESLRHFVRAIDIHIGSILRQAPSASNHLHGPAMTADGPSLALGHWNNRDRTCPLK
jgi:hypothetical protein